MPAALPKPQRSWVTRVPFFYGWVVLAVASFAGFMSGPGQTYGVSVFVDPIIEDLGWSRTMISGLYTAGSLTAATTMVFVGRMLDRFGARTMLSVVGVLFGCAALLMSSISQPIHLFVGFTAIRTLGQGSLILISTTLVAQWFMRLRGRAMSLYFLGMAASQAAFPPLIYLLSGHLGWRGAWVILALLIWSAVVPLAVVFLRRTPESVGLHPDGDSRLPPGTGADEPPVVREVDWTLGEALRTRSFWLLLVAGSSQALIGTALVFHHVSVLDSRGLDAGVAAVVLSVFAPTSLVGAFVAGFLSDKLPGRFVLVAGQMLLAAGMALVLVISHPWQAFVYGGLMGLAGGAIMTTNAVIWPNYYGRANLGAIRGVVTTSGVAFAALGPLPFGLLFDMTGTYTVAVLVFLALPAACGVAALLATPPRKGDIQRRTG